MRALLALGNGCRLQPGAPHDLRPLRCRRERKSGWPLEALANLRQGLECGSPLPLWNRDARNLAALYISSRITGPQWKSARGLAHSTTLPRPTTPLSNLRQGLECGSPLPLWNGDAHPSEKRKIFLDPPTRKSLLNLLTATRPSSSTNPKPRAALRQPCRSTIPWAQPFPA